MLTALAQELIQEKIEKKEITQSEKDGIHGCVVSQRAKKKSASQQVEEALIPITLIGLAFKFSPKLIAKIASLVSHSA